jgi:hypothetical protein
MITALIYGYAESEIATGSFSQNDERDVTSEVKQSDAKLEPNQISFTLSS